MQDKWLVIFVTKRPKKLQWQVSFVEINYGCLSNLHCEKFNICLKKSNIKLKLTNNKLDFYIRIRYDKFKIRMKQSGIELFYTKSKVIT